MGNQFKPKNSQGRECSECEWWQASQESLSECMRERHEKVNALQAKIDALMFEYCPDEMTEEQIKNYQQHQRPSDVEVKTQGEKNET